MAEQIEVAHSKDIKGAGIVAGGPYACAESQASREVPFWPSAVLQNAQQALNQCMQTTAGTPDPKALAKRAEELAKDGKIDPLAGLADDNVYLFSGNEDQTVTRPVVEAAAEFLKDAGVAATNLTLVEKEGGHAFITEQGGAACGITATPFVSDCDYDQAKAILAWIYGPLTPAEGPPKGRFIVFDQQPFSEPGDGFADEGVVYVPPSCTEKPGCRVHIALHGCEQSREAVGDDFIKESGYAEIADANRLVILFPQAKAITGINPQGCWDWWGYTGPRLSRQGRAPDRSDLGHGRAARQEALSQCARRTRDGIRIVEAPLGSDVYQQSLAAPRGGVADSARASFERGGAQGRCAPSRISARSPMAPWWARSRSSRSIQRRFSSARWRSPRTGGGRRSAPNFSSAQKRLRKGEGFKRIVLNARLGAEGFYARFGYQAEGEPFDENTIPHIRMSKDLA